MVCLSKKKKNGKYYYYLEERAWINGKSTRLWQKYIGPEDKLKEMTISLSPQKLEYRTMDFGISAALLQIAKKIALVETVDQVAGKKRAQNLTQGEYLLIAAINRCVAPSSKTKLSTWFKHDYLSTVFQVDPAILNAQTYWNHNQRLSEEAIEQIELELIRKVLEVYKVDLSCLLFDPTNFYTFLAEHDPEQLAKFGKSKEGRSHLRIINLSLVCTLQDGIPLFHQTYQGNTQDAKHFKGMITKFTNRFRQLNREIEELVLIFDKGNHSPKVFTDIEALKIPFIASLRNSTQKDLLGLPAEEFTTITLPANGKEVGYHRTQREIYDVLRTVYVLFDPRKHKKESIRFEDKLQEKLTKIETFLEKLNVKKWRSKEHVEKKLHSLSGKALFRDIISTTVTGSFAELKVLVQVDEEKKAAHLLTLGRSIIFTNVQDWSATTVIQAFRDKYVIEETFSHLKNPHFLSIRPMYCWSDQSIRAHIFSCIMALLFLSLIRKELTKKSLSLSYKGILDALSELQLTQIFTSSTGPPVNKLNRHSSLAQKMFQILQLKSLLPK